MTPKALSRDKLPNKCFNCKTSIRKWRTICDTCKWSDLLTKENK